MSVGTGRAGGGWRPCCLQESGWTLDGWKVWPALGLQSYCLTPPVWAGTAGLAEPGAQGVAEGLALGQSLSLHSCCTLVFEKHHESDLH